MESIKSPKEPLKKSPLCQGAGRGTRWVARRKCAKSTRALAPEETSNVYPNLIRGSQTLQAELPGCCPRCAGALHLSRIGKKHPAAIPQPRAELPRRKERRCKCSRGPVQVLRPAGTGLPSAPESGHGRRRRVTSGSAGRGAGHGIQPGIGAFVRQNSGAFASGEAFRSSKEWHPTCLSNLLRGTMPHTAFQLQASRHGLAQALERAPCRNSALRL